MSTFYGIKPIVGNGLTSFIHGLNINGYSDGLLTDSLNNSDVEFEVTNSELIKRRQKVTFKTNGTDQNLTSISGSVYNPGTGSYTFNMWIKPLSNEGYIFEKGNQFNLAFTGQNHFLLYLTPNAFGTLVGVAVTGSRGWVASGASNVMHALTEFDLESMTVNESKWNMSPGTIIRNTVAGMAIDSASFMIGSNAYDYITEHNHSNNGWKTLIGNYVVNKPTYGDGDPETYGRMMRGVDFNHEFVFHSNSPLYNGLRGWVCKENRSDGSFVTSSYTNGYQYGLCIDKPPSTGSFGYVANYSYENIQKFTQSTMEIVDVFGTSGTGDDQFINPYGMTCDRDYLYIGDFSNFRIKKHRKSDLSYVMKTGSSDTDSDYYVRAYDLAVDDTHLYTVGLYELKKFNKETFEYIGKIDFANYRSSCYHYGLKAVWASGSIVYLADRANDFKSYKENNYGNFTKYGEDLSVDSYGDIGSMLLDQGIKTEPTGFVWSSDQDFDAVWKHKFNSDHTLTVETSSYDGLSSTTDLGWNYVMDVAIDFENRWLYATDYYNHRFKKLKLDDLNLIKLTGSSAAGDYQLDNPRGLCVSASYIYVCNTDDGNVKKFNSDLEYIETSLSSVWNMMRIRYDNLTNRFYTTTSTEIVRIYDHNFNLLKSKTFTAGRETFNAFRSIAYDFHVDDKWVYITDNYRTNILDKNDLTFENEIAPFSYTLRSDVAATGSWHNIGFTYDGNDLKLYLNGNYQISQSVDNANVSISNNTPMRFSKWDWYSYASQFTENEFGAIMTYDRVLSDDEMRQNYESLVKEHTK